MEVYRQEFIPEFIKKLEKQLYEKLAPKDIKTRMLWNINKIATDLITEEIREDLK